MNYMVHGVIYCATNRVNGKVYIGQTTLSLRQRINSHFGNDGKQRETYFKHALKKYGRASFLWQEIDSAKTQKDLNDKERLWISFYDSTDPEKGYNTNPGGLNYGRMPKVTREKISKTRMGYPGTMNGVKHTPEALEKIRLSKLGKKRKPFTAEARLHMGEVRKGKKKSAEHARHISEGLKGKMKPWMRISVINLTTGEVFDSVDAAAKKTGLFSTTISAVCRGRKGRHTAGGFRWAYFKKRELEAQMDAERKELVG